MIFPLRIVSSAFRLFPVGSCGASDLVRPRRGLRRLCSDDLLANLWRDVGQAGTGEERGTDLRHHLLRGQRHVLSRLARPRGGSRATHAEAVVPTLHKIRCRYWNM